MANPLVDSLRCSLQRDGLSGSTLIVALSGGPDSLALILALAELRSALNVEPRIAHFDHQLRSGSAADVAFVEEVGGRLGVPVDVGRGEVREIARREKIGLEEAGRRARYRFLAECRDRFQAAAVLVGHTADDQTETRLMHWLRGSGLPGLVGMAEDTVVEVPNGARVRVVRPLLSVRRQDTVAFCRERGVQPRIDPSNSDPSFTRNRVRHEVIPTLRAINPRLGDSLDRLARHAEAAEAFIQSELDRRIAAIVTASNSEWRIDRHAWRSLPTALKQALLRRASDALGPRGPELDSDNLDAGVCAADTWSAGKTLAWPGGIEFRVEYDSILIRHGGATDRRVEAREISTEDKSDVEVRCSSVLSESADEPRILQVRRRSQRCGGQANDAWHCDLDAARIEDEGGLVVRARQTGDWIQPEGMTGRKKVQDLLVDAHVPRVERDRVPIVATSAGVAWIAGVRRDRRYVASDATRDVLCLRLTGRGCEMEKTRRMSEAGACTI